MRALFFLVVLLTGFLTPWWLFLCVGLLYALRYRAYELIVLGLLLDAGVGLSGLFTPFPYIYVVMMFVLVVLGDVVRPRIVWFGGREGSTSHATF